MFFTGGILEEMKAVDKANKEKEILKKNEYIHFETISLKRQDMVCSLQDPFLDFVVVVVVVVFDVLFK